MIISQAQTAANEAGEERLDESGYGPASRKLYTFLLGKINTDMHERTATIEKKNGFELYRVIYNSIDPISSNADFACDQAIMKMGFDAAGKIKNLKDLYEVRVALKKKVAEYKKIRGREPDHHVLKNILFSCMDLESQQHIMDFGLDKPRFSPDGKPERMYKIFFEDIDKRYKLKYGTLEARAKKSDRDDPMGIHAVAEASRDRPATDELPGEDNALDAIGKGGKSKGKGDGRCRTCNGEGHFACP